MKKTVSILIAFSCLLLSACTVKLTPSQIPNSGTTNSKSVQQDKMKNANMHPIGEELALKRDNNKQMTKTINSCELVLKPQELNADFITLETPLKVDENGTIAPEMMPDNAQPISMLMISYTVKNTSKEVCTFYAADKIYRIDTDTYKILDAENSYLISQDKVWLVYVDADRHNGKGKERHLITLEPDEEITISTGYLVETAMLDSTLACSINPYGTDIKSAIAEVVLGNVR